MWRLLLVVIALVAIAVWLSRTVARETFANIRIDEVYRKEADRSWSPKRGGRARARAIVYKDLTKHPRSKFEAAVIQMLESITGLEFPTAYPPWLTWRGHNLELDGYNGKLAIEVSGPLHRKWTPTMESYPHYFNRIVRDVVKQRLCHKNGVTLITVDSALPREHWRNYLISRLYDAGAWPAHGSVGAAARPPGYISEQTFDVYRNDQIEAELGLATEMCAAQRV